MIPGDKDVAGGANKQGDAAGEAAGPASYVCRSPVHAAIPLS